MCKTCCVLRLAVQVVSAGALGVYGQNGWFCGKAEVEQWGALMGWRGLRDGAVRLHFNNTFVAFHEDWG